MVASLTSASTVRTGRQFGEESREMSLIIISTWAGLGCAVLVTSFQPMRAYIHRLGFARFCSVEYSSAAADLADMTRHLTNVAIQVGHV